MKKILEFEPRRGYYKVSLGVSSKQKRTIMDANGRTYYISFPSLMFINLFSPYEDMNSFSWFFLKDDNPITCDTPLFYPVGPTYEPDLPMKHDWGPWPNSGGGQICMGGFSTEDLKENVDYFWNSTFDAADILWYWEDNLNSLKNTLFSFAEAVGATNELYSTTLAAYLKLKGDQHEIARKLLAGEELDDRLKLKALGKCLLNEAENNF